jgi:OmpA-OmpF porin, OOP family
MQTPISWAGAADRSAPILSRGRRLFLAGCGLALVVLAGGPASAQTARGFALDRFTPSGGNSDWFALESLDFGGHFRPSGGVTFNWADQPLSVHDSEGNAYGNAIVSSQMFLHGGLALMLFDRVRAGLNFPLAVHQAGNAQVVGDLFFRSASRVAAGDLRVAADALLTGAQHAGFQLAAGVEVLFPTGVRSQYTSDGVIRVAPRVMAAGQFRRKYVYAARLGFQTRGSVPERQRNLVRIGHEINGGLALGVRPSEDLVVGAEVYGGTAVTNGNYLRESVSPLEVLFSARFRPVESFHIMLGVAPGITAAIGTPTIRLLARLEYTPPFSLSTPRPPS